MKQVILFFVCLLLISKIYCQVLADSTFKENYTKSYYLQKSRNQNSSALVLAIGGVLIFTATGIIASQNLDFINPVKHRYIAPIGLSIACVAGSIPLFIAAGRNKLKAAKVMACFKMQRIPVLQQTTINFQSYPAISFKLNL